MPESKKEGKKYDVFKELGLSTTPKSKKENEKPDLLEKISKEIAASDAITLAGAKIREMLMETPVLSKEEAMILLGSDFSKTLTASPVSSEKDEIEKFMNLVYILPDKKKNAR